MLPEGWTKKTISEIGDVVTGNTPSPSNEANYGGDVPFVTPGDMTGAKFVDTTARTLSVTGGQQARLLPRGAILVTCIGSSIGKVGVSRACCATNQQINAVLAGDKHDGEFVYYQLLNLSPTLQKLAGNQAVPIVNKTTFASQSILIPSSKEEQIEIRKVIDAWDSAIATTERLLANSRALRQAVSNELLSGRKRFQVRHPWQAKPISDLITESRISGSGGDEARKLTVKLYAKGVVAKADKRKGSDATQYYRRTAGQFIYSKLDFLNGAFGLIPDDLEGYESTLDLPAFDFRPGVNPRWFLHFVSRKAFYRGHLGLANGGRKARRVNPSDLVKVVINVPSLDEQNRIAAAIDHADQIVCAEENKLALLRAEKAALMQQLLTGKRRVRIPAAAAEAEPA